ncbi:MAG: DUF3426 domain-containing protein [Betaproteobacteria bacterium]|nr:DUF3426 domain-containing protein [Betaproteobacteria bacterium]
MRTRCPACATVFRVTSEQLRLKAGKVRCGHCQGVFNAFDQLLLDGVDETPPPPVNETPASFANDAFERTEIFSIHSLAAPSLPPEDQAEESEDQGLPVAPQFSAKPAPPAPILTPSPREGRGGDASPLSPSGEEGGQHSALDQNRPGATARERVHDALANLASKAAAAPAPAAASPVPTPWSNTLPPAGRPPADDEPPTEAMPTVDAPDEEYADSNPEQSTRAAREAGLVAAREWTETAAFDRWAADALADDTPFFAPEAERRTLWPFVIVAFLLMLLLAVQLLLYFRTEVVRQLPATADYYERLGIEVALPRLADLIVIEASDLQADNARDQFVLHATLRNRAPYAQEWPALELTLTDAADAVVVRRVLTATEYLPPEVNPERFPARGEVAVRLWIEARGLDAAGYRLYLFYP